MAPRSDPVGGPGIVRGARVSSDKRALARKFRRDPTRSERLAWALLRNRRCLGLKFRRQQVVRGYIVDFYCAELRRVLEGDGAVHHHPHRAQDDLVRMLHLLTQADIRIVRSDLFGTWRRGYLLCALTLSNINDAR
jgi:very-short-patch-repair endonuclease